MTKLSDSQELMMRAVRAKGEEGLSLSPFDRTMVSLEKKGLVRQEPIEGRTLVVKWFLTES